MRKIIAVIVAAGFVALTAGCSSTPSAASCTPLEHPGSVSALVTATGSVGSKPKVAFPTPVIASTVQTSTLTVGKGELLTPGSVADAQASLYVGKTGKLLTATTYDASQPIRLTVGSKATGTSKYIARALQCETVGTRSATVLTVRQMFGAGQLDPSSGVTDNDTLVLVTDAIRGYLGKANGAVQMLQPGFPQVVTTSTGTPGITLPDSNPPSTLMIERLRVGSGAKIARGDLAVLHYTGVLWPTDGAKGTVFNSTWASGTPATFDAVPFKASDQTGLVPGLLEALVGQTVGSQVLVVIPPKFGYPSGSSPSTVPAGSTMVFVLDILGIQ